jgi:lysophospholipase L1-like esterase
MPTLSWFLVTKPRFLGALCGLGVTLSQPTTARARVMTWYRPPSTTESSEAQPRPRISLVRAVTAGSSSSARQQLLRAQRVAVLGDSMVADGLLVHYLRRVLGSDWQVDNYGLNSDTPGQMLRRIRLGNHRRVPGAIDPTRYGVVIVLGGVNGIYPDIDAVNGARTQLAALFRRLRTVGKGAQHPKVVGLTMLPWGDWRGWSARQELHTQRVNRWLVGLPAEGQAEPAVAPPDLDLALDLHTMLVDPTSLEVPDHRGNIRPRLSRRFTNDGLHLNLAGARQAAELIARALTRGLVPALRNLEAVSDARGPNLAVDAAVSGRIPTSSR